MPELSKRRNIEETFQLGKFPGEFPKIDKFTKIYEILTGNSKSKIKLSGISR